MAFYIVYSFLLVKDMYVDFKDDLLETVEPELARIKMARARLDAEYNFIRDRAFRIFDELFGEDESGKFTSPTGYVISRRKSPKEPKPLINIDALTSNIDANQWHLISDESRRTLNEDKLAKAIDDGELPSSLLDLIVTYKEPIYSLHYDLVSQQDKIGLEIEERAVS